MVASMFFFLRSVVHADFKSILLVFLVSENVEMLSKLAPRLLAVTARGKTCSVMALLSGN